MLTVQFNRSRLDDLDKLFENTAYRVTDMSEPMREISRLLFRSVERIFATEDFGQWKPHAPETVRRWGEHRILRLYKSGVTLLDTVRREAGPTWAAVFTKNPVAHLHQRGTEQHGKEHTPMREIFGVASEGQYETFGNLILDHVLEEWQGLGSS